MTTLIFFRSSSSYILAYEENQLGCTVFTRVFINTLQLKVLYPITHFWRPSTSRHVIEPMLKLWYLLQHLICPFNLSSKLSYVHGISNGLSMITISRSWWIYLLYLFALRFNMAKHHNTQVYDIFMTFWVYTLQIVWRKEIRVLGKNGKRFKVFNQCFIQSIYKCQHNCGHSCLYIGRDIGGVNNFKVSFKTR